MAWYGIALNGSVGLLLRACDTQKSTITRPLVCSLSPRAMEMTKETKLKKSIYTVAVSLPPWYLPVSSLEKKQMDYIKFSETQHRRTGPATAR
jgi:hypothetical protein